MITQPIIIIQLAGLISGMDWRGFICLDGIVVVALVCFVYLATIENDETHQPFYWPWVNV